MFENIKDNIEIKKLENKISKTKFFYYQLADKAQKENKGRNEIQAINAEMDAETLYYRCDLKFLKTRTLLRTAKKLNVPIPKYNNEEFWEKSLGQYYLLSDNGRHMVTKLIRKERKERLDYWLPYVVSLFGLLIALISILKN